MTYHLSLAEIQVLQGERPRHFTRPDTCGVARDDITLKAGIVQPGAGVSHFWSAENAPCLKRLEELGPAPGNRLLADHFLSKRTFVGCNGVVAHRVLL